MCVPATYGSELKKPFEPLGGKTVQQKWRTETEPDSNPFRYSGEYFDEETGLIYLRNRYYDPETGRFISEDPHWNIDNMIYGDKEYKDEETKIPDMHAIMQSSNLYAYCMNNPMKYVDPSGEGVIVLSAATVAVLKAAIGAIVAIETAYTINKIVSNISDNRKHHILHGSNNSHENGWKKFNIDPNDPKGFEKLLPILNEVIKNGTKSEWKLVGKTSIREIEYYFPNIGETVKVILNKTAEGIESITDAYTIFK